jgi:hypothetical protein
MRAAEFVEDILNKNEYVRQPRAGSRHKRGHKPVERYRTVKQDEKLDELDFMGMSRCTKDCSGHEAGYAWSKQRGGAHAASWSPSFNKGAEIAAAGY